MRKLLPSLLTSAFVLGALTASQVGAQEQSGGGSDVFFGGNFGFSFGDVEYIEVAPLIGKQFTPSLSAGGSLIYRYRNDKRYREDLSTHDYGASVFGRYHFHPMIFAQAEYEYLRYEFYDFRLNQRSDTAHSVFIGGGFNLPITRSVSFFTTTLYNVNHDDDSPYDYPWVIRVGISAGL